MFRTPICFGVDPCLKIYKQTQRKIPLVKIQGIFADDGPAHITLKAHTKLGHPRVSFDFQPELSAEGWIPPAFLVGADMQSGVQSRAALPDVIVLVKNMFPLSEILLTFTPVAGWFCFGRQTV